MATSIIDGTIEEAQLARGFWNMRVFNPVIIRTRDGQSENLGKTIVEGHLAAYIVPGAAGRFYRYATIDHKGIHGVRLDNGEEAYGFARNNEIAAIACFLFGAVLVAIYLLSGTIMSSLMWVLVGIGGATFPLYWSVRREASRQFDGDESYRAPAPAESAPA